MMTKLILDRANMGKWDKLASDQHIKKTIDTLKQNGIEALVVDTAQKAKDEVLKRIPKGAEVMTMTSVTLDAIGIPKEINESGKYNSVRKKLMSMDRATQSLEMNKLGAAPEYAIGSVHAVTQDGKALIASNTGSQMSAYVYASPHVIWVVSTQKIVENLEGGIKRIYDYILPLESKRLQKVFGPQFKSNVSKLFIINREVKPGRVTLIFVKQKLGF